MAGAGAKKAAGRATQIRELYTKIVVGLYSASLLSCVVFYSSLGFWDVLGLAFLTIVNYLCMSAIFSNAEAGVPFTNYQDILWVNWFVQGATVLSTWFWLCYLLIPGYAAFKWGGSAYGFIRPMCCGSKGGGEAEDADLSEAQAKKQAKKDRQEKRFGNRR